jgi:hypothetical protein
MPEIHDYLRDIERLAMALENHGDEIKEIADRMEVLKFKLETGERKIMQDLFKRESGGKIARDDGEQVKLTDAMREQIANFGQINERAEYEACKRKLDALKTAVSAKQAAMSGFQSLTSVAKKEIDLELAAIGPSSRFA